MKKTIITTIIAAGIGLQVLPSAAATRAEIAATVSAACAGGGDCAGAVQAAVALATNPDLSVAIGQGLADAVATIGATDPELATMMLTVIAAAPTEVQMAYQIAVDVMTASGAPAPAVPAPATPAPPAATQAGSPG